MRNSLLNSCLFLALSALSISVNAQTTFVGISGGSNIIQPSDTSAVVYGGMAGAACDGSQGPCDNCTGGLTACNHRRITPSTPIVIQFKSDATNGADGYPLLENSDGDDLVPAGTLVTKGNIATITTTWAVICGDMGDATCALNSSKSLRVGFDNSADQDGAINNPITIAFKVQSTMPNTVDPTTACSSATGTCGITDFLAFPGDAKIYLEDLSTHSPTGFPTTFSIQYSKLWLYWSEGQCAQIANVQNNTTTREAKNIDPTEKRIDDDRFMNGFTNGTYYVFRVALEDLAGNIGLFTNPSPCIDDVHSAKPDEVFGLLKERQNCFIATAAFGSPMEKHVKLFREFRDKILIKAPLGSWFVSRYYDLSPPVAKMIAENKILKKATEISLYPLWGFSVLALNIGFWPALIVAISLLISAIIMIRMTIQNMRRSRI